MNRPRPATESALGTLALVVGVGVVLSVVTIVPSGNTQLVAGGPGTGNNTVTQNNGNPNAPVTNNNVPGAKPGSHPGVQNPVPGSNNSGNGTLPPSKAGLSCDSQHNGGSTDRGISASNIHMAATTVTDGPGASFLAASNGAISAVAAQVNKAGGICGRHLTIDMRNDSWKRDLGAQYIQNFVQGEHIFGLAVNPDSEGLYEVASTGYIDKQQVPVVGSGGQTGVEYTDPWIWPVGTATISQMHIMAKDAYARGARHFAIAFESQYRFGLEGAYAFEKAVERLTGAKIPGFDPKLESCNSGSRFCGVPSGQTSYTSQATQFNNACFGVQSNGSNCDFVAYLMEPDTALAFLSNRGQASPLYGMAGAEPLFNRQAFANKCQDACNVQVGFNVWTGYQPPEGAYSGQAAESKYVTDMRNSNGGIDVDNQFVEGAYIGMNLLVKALQTVGPELTRFRLQTALDAMTFDSGLTKTLRWSPGHHFANDAAMGWRLNYSNGSFSGFSAATKFETDPWLGQDNLKTNG